MTDSASTFDELSAEELAARYRAEREKRLRPDGAAQYRNLDGVFADFDRDPFATPLTRDPIVTTTDVVIVGAGISGLVAAARLAELGVTDLRIIDKAGDFGGTWYWNRYPGAACDTESYIYMPLLEETGYIPTEKYAKAYEIFAHCQRIGRHYDLYTKAMFQTEVSDLSWDETAARWQLTTNRGDRITARFAIVAGGIMHHAKLPGIPGIETFKGHCFHTTRWDYAYTGGSPTEPMDKLRDKRVAVIGTGATAVQAVPRLAEAAGELLVFQRTPSGIGVRDNRPTDPEWAKSLKPGWQAERVENFTRIVSGNPVDVDLVGDGWTEIFRTNPAAFGLMDEEQLKIDNRAMGAIRRRVDEIVTDRATAEALKPWYHRMCKRPCFHDEYLPAFNRPNVRLVDTAGRGVEQITEDAIVVDGVSYPVDCIIYASGFGGGASTKGRLGFEIFGRGGVSLTEAWRTNGPETLHGIHARGFPNLMLFGMSQGGFAINFSHILCEVGGHAAWVIHHCLDAGIEQIETTAEASEAWFQTLIHAATVGSGGMGMFLAQCTPSYMNGEGGGGGGGARRAPANPAAAMRGLPFFGTLNYLEILRDWRAAGDLAGLELHRSAPATV